MKITPLGWLARNLSSLVFAFILALVVWISAVVTSDPNIEDTFRPTQIELVGQDPDLLLVSEYPVNARLTLKAPRSKWEQLNDHPELVKTWIDLSGIGPGEHNLVVQTDVDITPYRFVRVDPEEVQVTLEQFVSRQFPVMLQINGDPPLGYKKGEPTGEPISVTISGPKSSVIKVADVKVTLDMSGAIDTIQKTIPVEVVDEFDNLIPDLTVKPRAVVVTQPVNLLGGFRNVVVKVATTGQVANGYRLTNISVSPPNVTLFSDNPRLVDEIPGFVETSPVDLTNLNDDIEINVGLNLPEGVTMVREHSVLVQVSVAAIEGSMTLTIPVEVRGISPELEAIISPETVDVIVAGPLNVLDTLTPESFQVVLDLTGLPPEVYQIAPEAVLLPEHVRVQTTLPETVEVTIVLAPTLTPTAILTPEVTGTLTITITATPNP